MRLLVTGSRNWSNVAKLEAVLDGWKAAWGSALVIVHGHCDRGADALADYWAWKAGVPVERFPADWTKGRKAGPLRNQEMVDSGPNWALAFVGGASVGTWDTIRRCQTADIPVHIEKDDDE